MVLFPETFLHLKNDYKYDVDGNLLYDVEGNPEINTNNLIKLKAWLTTTNNPRNVENTRDVARNDTRLVYNVRFKPVPEAFNLKEGDFLYLVHRLDNTRQIVTENGNFYYVNDDLTQDIIISIASYQVTSSAFIQRKPPSMRDYWYVRYTIENQSTNLFNI